MLMLKRRTPWQQLEAFFLEAGKIASFAFATFNQFFKRPFEHKELLRQSYYIGYKSIPLISVTGFIIGLVLTLQSRPVLLDFGAESLLPSMVSISIFREIGPVITALICAGRISSGIGAEIGAMKVTEQIDAMEVSGTNPMKFVVATRVMATTLMVPLLVFIADALAMTGTYFALILKGNLSVPLFIDLAFSPVEFIDLIPATIKSFFFGYIVGLIGCYKGYQTHFGTESVGMAANSAVVSASFAIFIIDLIAVQITDLFYSIM